MIWVLVILGLVLAGVGVMRGQGRAGKAPRGGGKALEGEAAEAMTLDDALDILSRPMEKAGDGRSAREGYRNGILTGLGAGLLVAGLALAVVPASLLPQRAPAPGPAPAPTGGATAPAPGGAAAAPTPPTPAAPPATAAPVTFVVAPGDLPPDVAAKLKAAGLIADPAAFLARLSERGVDTLLKAGTFQIPAGASLDQVIDALTA